MILSKRNDHAIQADKIDTQKAALIRLISLTKQKAEKFIDLSYIGLVARMRDDFISISINVFENYYTKLSSNRLAVR